jgi:hypothetical protein
MNEWLEVLELAWVHHQMNLKPIGLISIRLGIGMVGRTE